MTSDDARKIVDAALLDVMGKGPEFVGNEDIVTELRVDGDDLTFLFIPFIEKAAGISVPAGRWATVGTINEVVALIVEFASSVSRE